MCWRPSVPTQKPINAANIIDFGVVVVTHRPTIPFPATIVLYIDGSIPPPLFDKPNQTAPVDF